MDEVLDFCIVITTYNRPTKLYSLLKSIYQSKKDYNIKIFVFDDIISFRKKITKKDIENINMIIYHNENKI